MHQQAVMVAGSFHRLDLFPFSGPVIGEIGHDTNKLRFLIQLYRRQGFDGVRQQVEITVVDIVLPSTSGSGVLAIWS